MRKFRGDYRTNKEAESSKVCMSFLEPRADFYLLRTTAFVHYYNWTSELAQISQLRTIRNRSGTHKPLGSGLHECIGLLVRSPAS